MSVAADVYSIFSLFIWLPFGLAAIVAGLQVWGAVAWRKPYKRYIVLPLLAFAVTIMCFVAAQGAYKMVFTLAYAALAFILVVLIFNILHPRPVLKLLGVFTVLLLNGPVYLLKGQDLAPRVTSAKSINHAMQCSSLMDGGCYWGDYMHSKKTKESFEPTVVRYLQEWGYSPDNCFMPDVDISEQMVLCLNSDKSIQPVGSLAHALGVITPQQYDTKAVPAADVSATSDKESRDFEERSHSYLVSSVASTSPEESLEDRLPPEGGALSVTTLADSEHWPMCLDYLNSKTYFIHLGGLLYSYRVPTANYALPGCGTPVQLKVRAGNAHAMQSWVHESIANPPSPPKTVAASNSAKKESDKKEVDPKAPVEYNHPVYGKYICIERQCHPVRKSNVVIVGAPKETSKEGTPAVAPPKNSKPAKDPSSK